MTTTLTARAIAFDMDGTLTDALALIERVWTAFALRTGNDPAVVLASIHGVRAEESVARFAPAGSDARALADEILDEETAHGDETAEVPGAAAFVASLPPAAYGIVTSSPTRLVDVRLRAAGIRVPDVLITGADVTRSKPDPEGYLQAAARLGVAGADLIVFEDAEAGIAAGLAAGAQVVVVGAHTSALTEDLPRITDYRAVRAVADPATDVLTVSLG